MVDTIVVQASPQIRALSQTPGDTRHQTGAGGNVEAVPATVRRDTPVLPAAGKTFAVLTEFEEHFNTTSK